MVAAPEVTSFEGLDDVVSTTLGAIVPGTTTGLMIVGQRTSGGEVDGEDVFGGWRKK